MKECLEREIMEELGIEVNADKSLLVINHEYEGKSISLHLFHCSWINGEPAPLACDEINWVRPEDLDRYRLPPPDLKFIPFIKKWIEDKYGATGSKNKKLPPVF